MLSLERRILGHGPWRVWPGVVATVVFFAAAAHAQAEPFVYVTTSANVAQFDVGAGGLLSPLTPASVPADLGPEGVAVSHDRTSAYATNGDSGTVSQYDVGAGGALSPKT